MSDSRLWNDFRLSTLDRSRKRAAHLRFWGGSLLVLLGFWWILGQFWAVFRLSGHPLRISAVFGHPLRGFILPFLRLSCLGGYLYHQRQKRLTEPQNSRRKRTQKQPRRSTPERSQKKSRQRSDRQRLLYLLCLFQDLGQDHERQNQHTQNSQFFTPP